MEYGAIDLHKNESQIRIVTDSGEMIDRAREKVWRQMPNSRKQVATIDMDSTIKEVYGECYEAVVPRLVEGGDPEIVGADQLLHRGDAREAQPVARQTGYSEMTDHRFLTPDRSVQQTAFANGTTSSTGTSVVNSTFATRSTSPASAD